MARQKVIAQSITYSVLHNDKQPSFFARLPAYFYLYWLSFRLVRGDLFSVLRGDWDIQDNEYRQSFWTDGQSAEALKSMGGQCRVYICHSC